MSEETQQPKTETPTDAVDQGRYSLQSDGQVYWQKNSTNPLPGDVVGRIEKGESILSPKVAVTGDKPQADVQAGIDAHIRAVLAPIFALKDQEGENALTGVAQSIGDVVYDNMGVVHRSDIEQFVPELTPELRQPIRRKRLKMGPILVFLMDLMKPAAVNMRALLWGVWNGKTLPMETPADGRVSVTIDPENVDRHFYRSIGYPVFGNKAIRIDMLDRVITDIYDSAENWQFRAKHQYAEWLGCNIEDLYGILASMGHIRIPSEQPAESAEPKAEEVVSEEAPAPEATTEATEEKPAEAKKPELDLFKLKKGKISDRPQKARPQKFEKSQGDKPKFKKKPQKGKPQQQGVKTFTAKPKADEIDDSNPFAILKQLKTK